MKKILIVGILIASLLLSGCVWTFNLCTWSSSDTNFNNLISTLDTPKKAVDWLKVNCTYTPHTISYNPYQVYSLKKGVCSDFSCFGRYAAHAHGYTSYDLILQFSNKTVTHSIAVYQVSGTLDYSSNMYYYDRNYSTIQQIVNDWSIYNPSYTVSSWYVNDYCNNVVNYTGITSTTKFYQIEGLNQTEMGTFIGAEVIDRGSTIGIYTLVNKTGAALYSGTVQKIRIWANTTLTNCEIGIFYVVSGNNLSTRSSQTIGTVTAGAVREFNVNLAVQAGDYIGMYYTAGKMDINTSGGSGIWYLSAADGIPCTNRAFSYSSGYVISLGGLVITPR